MLLSKSLRPTKNVSISAFYPGPRLYRLGLAWLAFSAPLGYCIFYNTTATLYYLSDCVSALLDMFWFLPWLRNVFEYILLIPYRLLCVLTGGGYYEDAWRKVLQILLKEYTKKEKDALKVSKRITGKDISDTLGWFHLKVLTVHQSEHILWHCHIFTLLAGYICVAGIFVGRRGLYGRYNSQL